MVSAGTIRVVLVDDDPLVRAGLKLILGGSPQIEVLGEAADGADAAALVDEFAPDVVLMDIRMPRLDGLAATEALLKRPNPPRVIMLTTFDADDMVLRALAVGAAGFLLKDTPPARMVEAIQQVASGEHSLSPTVTAQVIAAATQGEAASRRAEALDSLATLNDREREVALAIGQGLTNAQISQTYFMSVATVKAHVTRILEKLGVTNRVQVAIRVHDAGLG
ncbi:response regulator [Propionibacteriaceae bacterium G57]|uniref:response regulator n=1 Tax=Aestuariimicrobium sp. G57 TaxID=3418485 RepID=UPI003DA74E53